jgi:hypothetical protein
MAKLRYIGSIDKTLVDIAAVTFGTEFVVDDDVAMRILANYPEEYEIADTATPAQSETEDAPASAKTPKKSTQDTPSE